MTDIDLQPTLTGDTISLRPLASDDFPALYEAASDPGIWELHPDSLRHKREIFYERFFMGAMACGGALIVEQNETGRIIGSTRYYDWDPDKREIAIGYTFLERKHWGSGINREMKDLMLVHIFKHADLVWFHVGQSNIRSRRAVERLGAVLSHEEEQALDGASYTQLCFKLSARSYRDRQHASADV